MVLPTCFPGIITGIILSIGRAVGESAAVILTAGSALGIPSSFLDPGRTLTIHLYILAVEGISMDKAYATGTVLIVFIVIINIIANWLMGKQKQSLNI